MTVRRMPAEWERHEATWIAWPHNPEDWPGKFDAIPWVYAEIVRALHPSERVEILCHDDTVRASASACLDAHGIPATGYRLHVVPNDRSWLRDSAPTGVLAADGTLELLHWQFNAWAKYDNYADDAKVGAAVSAITGAPRTEPTRMDTQTRAFLEGGAFDCDGAGRVLVTEECLLSAVQERNPGLDRAGYERLFAEYLGATATIWLGEGCAGDDTHGHVDDVARFVAPGVVVLAFEPNGHDENHSRALDSLRKLEAARQNGLLEQILLLPYPRPVTMNGQRLPASYANFYIANDVVLVPTFNDPSDRIALEILAGVIPDRTVIGIHSVDLVWGLGTLHCLTQQQPAAPSKRTG